MKSLFRLFSALLFICIVRVTLSGDSSHIGHSTTEIDINGKATLTLHSIIGTKIGADQSMMKDILLLHGTEHSQ
jgi:hypothetical protein